MMKNEDWKDGWVRGAITTMIIFAIVIILMEIGG